MSSSSGPPEVPAGRVQLNGWKDIAAYLGRSVRTVQRWEKDFGLPVRRFGLSRPESVFALPREIDAWLQTAQGVSARSGTGSPDQAGGPAAPPKPLVGGPDRRADPLFRRTPLNRLILAALVCVATGAVVWAAWVSWQLARHRAGQPVDPAPAVAAPSNWTVDLDALVVSDAGGNVLWRHRFPRELHPDAYEGSGWTPRIMVGGITDVEGDGTREVWLIAKSGGGPAGTALYLFEHDGRVRWTYRPTMHVRFGADSFGPSWIVDRAFVTADPAGGPGRAIWAVLYDSALFPSSIQRLDPASGAPLSSYWTNGSIVTAVLDESASPPRLLVGACYNETRAGSLSVLDARNANGSAPAALEKYRCTSCPPGEPLAFLVFPKPARFRGQDATGPVEIVTPMADGTLGVRVRYAWSDARTLAVGVFGFDPSLTPFSADTADDYLKVYDELAARGDVAAGAPATVDPDREFFPILKWDGAAKRFVEVRRAAAAR
jgi:hypothetical protein